MRLARVRGLAFYVDPVLLLLLALLVAGAGGVHAVRERLALVGILLGSVLAHELGHALAARRRGLRVGGVFLHLLPFAYVERGAPRDALVVAFAGPATSLLLALLLVGLRALAGPMPPFAFAPWTEGTLTLAALVNALMGTVNLLPVLPLDGGRALRALLAEHVGGGAARAWTARVGALGGVTLAALAVAWWALPLSAYAVVLGVWLCVVARREARGG